jgi:hypothetical protein
MRSLSKSKILAYRQCPKRLWLEIHRPDLKDDSGAEAVYRIGNEVGAVARLIYNESGKGVFLDLDELGFEKAFAQSETLLREGNGPVFEAGLRMPGALAFADVLVPERSGDEVRWRMIEVKSASGVKDYYRDDIAVQAFVAGGAGIPLASVAIAHVESSFVYEGDGDYRGLLREVDFTEEAESRRTEVAEWLSGAQDVAAVEAEPAYAVGEHCSLPFVCPFTSHCHGEEEEVEYPLSSLPNFSGRRRAAVEALGIRDLRDVPDEYLTPTQKWVREVTRSGETWLDAAGAAADLAGYGFPVRFLDFESVMLAVPIWRGRRPYEQIPFQFSLHRRDEDGTLTHEAFLDLSGADPAEPLARALLAACGTSGPVFAYNASFEKTVIRALAVRFPEFRSGLLALVERIIDLLPIAKARFYDPAQHGRWGLKAILPAACPDLSYDHLEGVADGAMAVEAYKEAVAPGTTPERKAQIERELLAYCHLDTLGLVRLWERFRG